MIDDFNKEKSEKKERKKRVKNIQAAGRSRRMRNRPWITLSSVEKDCEDSGKKYDPVYGTLKDKFWKDLELGRHQNHSQLFSADMYSKVKGFRRAAHTDAVANIQKRRHWQSRSSHASSQPTLSIPKSSTRHLRGDYVRKPRSSSPVSSQHVRTSPRSRSPALSPVSRMQKRSTDTINSADCVYSKRSRRSREGKNDLFFYDNHSNFSSVTSETVAIVTTSSPVTPPVMTETSTVSQFSLSQPVCTVSSRSSVAEEESSDSDDSEEYAGSNGEKVGRMTVSSETMLTVTTETKRLDMDTKSNDDMSHIAGSQCHHLLDGIQSKVFKQSSGGKCQAYYSRMQYGASGDESENLDESSFDAIEATSGEILSVHCKTNKTLKRSTLVAQSEASGAVERTHGEDCLWNGACNRSDCKSNRRRNMKNGHGKIGKIKTGETDSDNQNVEDNTEAELEDTADVCAGEGSDSHVGSEDTGCLCIDEDDLEDEHGDTEYGQDTASRYSKSEGKKIPTNLTGGSSDGGNSGQPSSSSSSSSSLSQSLVSKIQKSFRHSASDHRSLSSKSSSSQSSAQNRRSLFSFSHADSSDSSFDDGLPSGAPLSRESISDSFSHMDALAQRLHMDTLANSTTSKISYMDSTLQGSSGGASSRPDVRKSSIDTERPGLFSENNGAFIFARQISELEQHTQPVHTAPSSSITPCSPGKENFGSSKSKSSLLPVLSSSIRSQAPVSTSVPNTNSTTLPGNQVQPISSQLGACAERPERHARKRGNDIFQPLEKIPSPNLRECDLDQRIMTLTCEELEDFVEQGEERYKQKDTSFITNADLLQAVNLNKAEVVKRAVKQFQLNEHKLDIEQPDSTGLTLLMRAVQRGTVAIAEMLLENGVNVNAQQVNGTTALMIAAEQNTTCLVALLLKYGANSSLYAINSDQADTALMKAIRKQHREVVNLMLRVGVNIAPPTCTSMSALELAIERRNPHIEGIVRFHCQRLDQAFRSRILATLDGTANLLEPLFAVQCFPLRESNHFTVKFNSNIHPVAPGEGFLLFIAHTKITEKGVKCRFHGGCPISSVTLNGIAQSPLTKEVNFVTSCHPIIHGCNTIVIHKMADYTSKAKLVVQAFRARLLPG